MVNYFKILSAVSKYCLHNILNFDILVMNIVCDINILFKDSIILFIFPN